MGIGHKAKQKNKRTSNQSCLFKTSSQHRFSYGGVLRNRRSGRGTRPLSTKEPLHLVFKVNREKLRQQSLRSPQGFALVSTIIKKYAGRFMVKIEQLSIQNNHIHALIRTSRRSQYQHFFRVVTGQIAQCFAKEGLLRAQVTGTLRLWQHRPFTRVVRGWKAYQTVRDYIQLNEKEARGEIRYQKNRLRGLARADWEILWS